MIRATFEDKWAHCWVWPGLEPWWSLGLCRRNLSQVATSQRQISYKCRPTSWTTLSRFSLLLLYWHQRSMMAGSIGGSSLCLDQHVILFQLCRNDWIQISLSTVLKTEGYLLGALLFYCLFAFWGSSTNSKKAKNWHVSYRNLPSLTATNIFFHSPRLAQYLPTYKQQFSKPQQKDGLVADGCSDSFNFSTGRRNIASLHTIFTMRPRHDFFQLAFQTGRTFVDLQYRPRDDLQLDFKLSPGALNENFVFAIVAKDELVSVKDCRWDLVRILIPTS